MPESRIAVPAVADPSPAPPKKPAARRRNRRLRGLSGIYQSCISALQSLRSNKTRSLLTSLGIIIGVGAVIVMISIGEASAASINQRLSGLNPTEIIIRPGSASSGGVRQGGGTLQTLTQADADAIASQVPNVAAVSPVINVNGQVVFRDQNWATAVQGVYPDYQQIGSWQVQEGNFFTSADEQNAAAVAVIGQTAVTNLFTPLGVDPLGQQIRIGNVPFTVVGVLASKGAAGGFGNADDVAYVPLSTAQQRLSHIQYVDSIDVTATGTAQVNNVQAAVEQLLEQRHHITNPQNDDFTIQNQSANFSTGEGPSRRLTFLLVGVPWIPLSWAESAS